MLNIVTYRFIYIHSVFVNIVIFSLALCNLGVIIPIGRGGLCKTSKRLYPPYNSIGIGPIKNPLFRTSLFSSLSIFHYFDLGIKIPNGIGGLGKSFNSTKPHVNP